MKEKRRASTGWKWVLMLRRLEVASRYLEGAATLHDAGEHAGALSRCYYAAYQAMWAAIGDPPDKSRWEHMGVIKTFVRGRWEDPAYPMTGPGLYERFRFPLRRLYDLRLSVDYHAEPMTGEIASWALAVVSDLIDTVRTNAR